MEMWEMTGWGSAMWRKKQGEVAVPTQASAFVLYVMNQYVMLLERNWGMMLLRAIEAVQVGRIDGVEDWIKSLTMPLANHQTLSSAHSVVLTSRSLKELVNSLSCKLEVVTGELAELKSKGQLNPTSCPLESYAGKLLVTSPPYNLKVSSGKLDSRTLPPLITPVTGS